MATLEVTRAALRNAVRACLLSAGADLLSEYPHGGIELGEISSVALGVQDRVHYPGAWEFGGMPSDHGFREGQTWVLAIKIRQLQDADLRHVVYGATDPTSSAPLVPIISQQAMGFTQGYVISQGKVLMLSAVDKSHDSVLCYAPLPRVSPAPIDFGPDVPAIGSVLFTLGWNTTYGKSVLMAPADKLAGAV